MKLTDLAVRNAKPDKGGNKIKKLSDGRSLYLYVYPNGSKYWRFRKVINGKETTRALGIYPTVTLAEARNARDNYLISLAKGVDPLYAPKPQIVLFEEVAREWHSRKKGWGELHAQKVLKGLENHAFPILGKRPIGDISTMDLLIPLRKMEDKGILETASRVKQYMNAIMRYAIQNGIIKYNPAQELDGAIETNKTKHRPALPLERLPELLSKIDNYHHKQNGRLLTQFALKLNLLIFIRSSELRFARWDEIDFDKSLWVIPAKREEINGIRFSYRGTKMKTPHAVPLSSQAIQLLKMIKNISGDEIFIFPGDHYQTKPMSENTINKALRHMGYDTKQDICGHGFRTMACSALTESGIWTREAVELQMSHRERNTVRAAYIHRAEHMQERYLMLQWWADYLDACQVTYVAPYDFKWDQKG
ncbi:tyrosine-type recombinase/integrase [Yersinia enterocolitica]|uniref:tyrosine-type recombinase/integrase n=1 Tax=Yersinia enterocolitica TaxID=630 RepID=UPI001C60CE96|nr:integrase arm-type DNA-binding domain-containing protein [Yersinia enterocolitica]MBW5875985.1 tyrosine-type recombinase/integrase [Yersinia enterocolitica]